MSTLFKGIGKSVLYVIGFPFLIAFILIMAVLDFVAYLIQFFKLIILFFTGRTIFSDLDEDIEAKAILEKQKAEIQSESKTESSNGSVQTPPIYSNDYFYTLNPSDKEVEENAEENKEEEKEGEGDKDA